MKKKFMKLGALVLATALLAACGGKSGSGNPSSKSDNKTLFIGGIAPLTGPVAEYGTTAVNGAKLAVKEINAAGGVNGMKLKFEVEDEQGKEDEALNAYTKLYDQGIDVLFGDITSKPSEVVAGQANKDGVPMITPTGTQPNITEGRPFIFRVCYTDPFQGEILAQYAKDNLKAKKVAILTNNSSEYSTGVAESFKKKAKDLSVEIVAEESYGDSDADFKAQLTNIAQKKPDAILVPDYYENIAKIAPQAKAVGLKATLIGPDGWDGVLKKLSKNGDVASIDGAVYTNHFAVDDKDQKVQKFVKAYKDEYGEDPSSFAALGYDDIYLVKAAVEQAKSKDKDKVKDALKKVKFEGVTGSFGFDNNNNPIKSVRMIQIKDGKQKLQTVVEPK